MGTFNPCCLLVGVGEGGVGIGLSGGPSLSLASIGVVPFLVSGLFVSGIQMGQDAAGFSQPGGSMMKGSDSRWQASSRDSSESDSMVGAGRGQC